MRRLLASELLRFRSRRLVVVLLVGALVATGVGLVIAAFQSTPPTAAELVSARARADQEVANCLTTDWTGVEIEGSLEDFCRANFGDPQQYVRPHLKLADLPKVLEGISSITSILGLIVGASFVAASWQTGTISTIFTWEPRRLRWFAGRILVLAVGVFVTTVLIVVFLSAGLAVAAALRGSTAGVGGDWWTDVSSMSLRVSIVAAISAVIGGAVAVVGRHTAAALGVVFVYTAVVEGLIRAFRPLWMSWLLGDNIVTFLSWRTTEFGSIQGPVTFTPGHAVLVILGYTAVVLFFGFTFVRIRDVQ
jgi:ABC-2 type transport system permease protein